MLLKHQFILACLHWLGLDPGEQYFQGMPESVKLDPSDAKFVDVIHTNGGYSPLGFYSGGCIILIFFGLQNM